MYVLVCVYICVHIHICMYRCIYKICIIHVIYSVPDVYGQNEGRVQLWEHSQGVPVWEAGLQVPIPQENALLGQELTLGRAWSTEGSCTSLPFPGRWRGKTFCAVLNITLCVLPPGEPVWALGPGADSHWLEGPGMSLKSGLSWTVWSSVNVCTLLGLHLSQCGIFHLWIKLLFRYCALRQMANLPRGTVPLHMGYTFMYILSCVMSNVITFYIQEYLDISLCILLSSYCTLGPLSRLCKWHFCRLKWMSCLFKRISSSADCIFSLKMFTCFLFLPHSHFCFAKQFLQERKTGSHFPRGCWVTHHMENHC